MTKNIQRILAISTLSVSSLASVGFAAPLAAPAVAPTFTVTAAHAAPAVAPAFTVTSTPPIKPKAAVAPKAKPAVTPVHAAPAVKPAATSAV